MSEPLVRVAWAPGGMVAGMWHEALRRAGVNALVRNRDAASSLYGAPATPFSCEILVTPADEAAAREILDALGATPA
jgi:hypothetical protein